VFLLIGLDVRLDDLTAIAPWAGWAIGATLLGRFVAVYLLLPVSNVFAEPAPLKWASVLFWGGLRGSLSIALALSLPASVGDRRLLVSMIFAVVLFSLLGQGLTLGPLLRALGFRQRDEEIERAEKLLARMACEQAALRRLHEHKKAGLLPRSSFERLRNQVEQRREDFGEQLLEIRSNSEAVRKSQDAYLERTLVESRKAQLDRLRRNGLISTDVARELAGEFDRGSGSPKNDRH
jgi:CPA1 family monovalent cation:H+ antiporter